MTILACARPFKRSEDLYLAFTSSLLLLCCFASSISIKLCEDGQWVETCEQFLGVSGAYDTNVFVVTMTIAMLTLSLSVIIVKTVIAAAAPTIRVVSTGREPHLDLPDECSYRCFLSHAWGTGQDQTHTMARQLQLLLPEARIWLDVDKLDDIGRLELSVRDSAVFVIFLGVGYFHSANCRRELYAALAARKPIVVVREADKAKGGADLEDYLAQWRDRPPGYPAFQGAAEVLERMFGEEEPVEWVQARDFQRGVEVAEAVVGLVDSGRGHLLEERVLEPGLEVAVLEEVGPDGLELGGLGAVDGEGAVFLTLRPLPLALDVLPRTIDPRRSTLHP